MSTEAKCPFPGAARNAPAARVANNTSWWPEALNLSLLHQRSALSNPMERDFDYAAEFKTLDLNAVIKDLHADRKSTRLNSSHRNTSRMPSSA